jgi:hypothetical protein
MIEKSKRRTYLTYVTFLIINPLVILFFQNCSVIKRSDLKAHNIENPSISATQIARPLQK